MDHEHLTFDATKPVSRRRIDVLDAYRSIVRLGFDVMEDNFINNPSYESNEQGHLAWDVSLLVRAACLAWRTSGEQEHLIRAVKWARSLCEKTDSYRSVSDWRGRSGPVWSAGSRYNAGVATIGSVDGVSVQLQAIGDRIALDRPDSHSGIVRVEQGGTWVWESEIGSLKPDEDSYLPDVLARDGTSPSVLLRGLNEPIDMTRLEAASVPLVAQRAPYLVHTGMIARALLDAALALTESQRAAKAVDITPGDLQVAAESAIRFHDSELTSEGKTAWYSTPVDFPGRRLGMALPHNHVSDVVTSHLLLAKLRRDDDQLELGRALARPFLQEVCLYLQGKLPHPWYYYPVGSDSFEGVVRNLPIAERFARASPRGEDSSHATSRVRALAEWKGIDDRLVDDKVMRAIARSLRSNFLVRNQDVPTLRWLPHESRSLARLGKADAYAGAWTALIPWDFTLERCVSELAFEHPPAFAFGATILSAAEVASMGRFS
jgi:hypothetical protein